MINILVTGGNGQLGKSIRDIFRNDAELKATYIDIDDLDLTNRNEVDIFIDKSSFDIIINCAAFTAVDLAEKNEVACDCINTQAVGFIAEAAKRNKIKVIHISTDYVFNGKNHLPYSENDQPDPQSVYGRTKLGGEIVLKAFCPSCVILRTAWLYSEYGNNFVKTMLRLASERDSINVVDDQIGTPTYAHDLANAIHRIVKADEWKPGIYHFSNEGVASWYDFTKAIMRISGIRNCKISPISSKEYPTAAQRPAFSVLNKRKIKSAYSLTIPHWEESLQKCIYIINSSQNQ